MKLTSSSYFYEPSIGVWGQASRVAELRSYPTKARRLSDNRCWHLNTQHRKEGICDDLQHPSVMTHGGANSRLAELNFDLAEVVVHYSTLYRSV